jgi:hypothetical protein
MSTFFAVVKTLVDATERSVMAFEAPGDGHLVRVYPQVPFRPRYLLIESPDFEIHDIKVGNLSCVGSPIPSFAFCVQNLDEWLEKGEIPERCRFNGEIAEVGTLIQIHFSQKASVPVEVFRAVLIGDLMRQRPGWAGTLRGRLHSIGREASHSFVEIAMAGSAFDSSVVRVPVADAELADLGASLGRGVRVDIKVEPEWVSQASAAGAVDPLADTERSDA